MFSLGLLLVYEHPPLLFGPLCRTLRQPAKPLFKFLWARAFHRMSSSSIICDQEMRGREGETEERVAMGEHESSGSFEEQKKPLKPRICGEMTVKGTPSRTRSQRMNEQPNLQKNHPYKFMTIIPIVLLCSTSRSSLPPFPPFSAPTVCQQPSSRWSFLFAREISLHSLVLLAVSSHYFSIPHTGLRGHGLRVSSTKKTVEMKATACEESRK